MVTGPIKSVKAILSGAKMPNSPTPAKQNAETVSKVKVSSGKPPVKNFGGSLGGPGRRMVGC